MTLPSRSDAEKLLNEHVQDTYQLYHAKMVATAMDGYAAVLNEEADLWFVTGLLHDIDFQKHPDLHPGPSLKWFKEREFPEELTNAVEAHAYGYNGFSRKPESKLDAGLLACDEISGIFYAYKQINPIPYGEMKVSSIKKRLNEKAFAAKIDRETIYLGIETLNIELDAHIENLIRFFSALDTTSSHI
jgi:predicted hydrolase (HD superfamily)